MLLLRLRERSQRFDPTRTHHNRFLTELPLKLSAVTLPPLAIQSLGLHLNHHDVVTFNSATRRFPQASRRRSLVGGDATEMIRQRGTDDRELSFFDGLLIVISRRQQKLDQPYIRSPHNDPP